VDPGAGLIEFLRGELNEPALDFAEAPVPLTGGFDTRIFAFRLAHAPPECAGPLILRVLGPRDDPRRALRERAIQNALADLGYPAPRVRWASAQTTVLGGAFLVMEQRPGLPLLKARFWNASDVLAETQARLHDLDAEVILRALDREVPALTRAVVSFDAYLAQLDARIAAGGLDGLRRGMDWLSAHRPAEAGRRAICHGDFHPYNLLHDGRVVTAVLDWPNTVVADPAFDVASTLAILRHVPVELATSPGPLRWVARLGRPLTVRRYLAAYRRRRPLDARVLPYYEAASCMRTLVRAAEHWRREGPGGSNPLDSSAFADRLAARFAAIAGQGVAASIRGASSSVPQAEADR
jgi:aminoglycoside phosphotransferase (APT) family kinase protein